MTLFYWSLGTRSGGVSLSRDSLRRCIADRLYILVSGLKDIFEFNEVISTFLSAGAPLSGEFAGAVSGIPAVGAEVLARCQVLLDGSEVRKLQKEKL